MKRGVVQIIKCVVESFITAFLSFAWNEVNKEVWETRENLRTLFFFVSQLM